uniref:RING-type domain-containing protein n=1 Tax=Meloidogyne incognita TaxID=6306 RepID=A0A914NAI3_MELIC
MVYYELGDCTVCLHSLYIENIYTLKNCNHTFHRECIEKWITEGSRTCPRCRVSATLNDIKQLFLEEAGDSSDESSDEFTLSSSNRSTQNSNLMEAIRHLTYFSSQSIIS